MRIRIHSQNNLMGFALAMLVSFSMAAWAQSPTTLQSFEKDAHLGGIEDALVGITVVNNALDGSVQTRHGNGLMLRCDGFVLVPEALFYTEKSGNNEGTRFNQSVTVTLYPGTNKQQQVKGRRPGWLGWVESGVTRQRLGYAVLKLDNVHSPSMRPLMPDTLKAGDKLTLAWSHWDESKHAFTSVQTQPVLIGERKPLALNDPMPPLYREQFTPLSSMQEAVMPGAILLTGEDLAVGIMPGNTPANTTRFANFASLQRATNCVTALPMGEDAFVHRYRPVEGAATALSGKVPFATAPFPATQSGAKQVTPAQKRERDVAASAPDMVAVPGGPVKLPPALMKLQLDMEASNVACVPPFLIDRYEVTNQQYLEFWKSLPEKMRADSRVRADMYPYGWGSETEPFPDTLAHVPVLGVRLPGARAYAKWAGKRLPTPYEWCLAAFGPTGGNEAPDWAKRFLKQRKDTWDKIVTAHERYALQHTSILPKFLLDTELKQLPNTDFNNPASFVRALILDDKGNAVTIQDESQPSIPEFFHLPWFFYKGGYQDDAAWSKQTIEELTEPLFQEWVDPMYVLPVGSRPFDVSPYGAMDMLVNAKELVAPGPIFPWNAPPRPGWPFYEADRYIEVRWGINDNARRNKMIVEEHRRYEGYIGPVSAAFAQTGMNDPETMLRLRPFGVNPLRLWEGNQRYISAGELIGPMPSIFMLNDWHMNPLSGIAYGDRMYSRRLRSASENARPDSSDYVLADLSAYVSAKAIMEEYNQILCPADDMIVDLEAGPIHEGMAYPNGETIEHHWSYEQYYGIWTDRIPNPKVKNKSIPRMGFFRSGPPSNEDHPGYLNGTGIQKTGSFPLWRGMPRHFHYEMGHPLGLDHDRPLSYNDRPYYNWHQDPGSTIPRGEGRPFALDTYLVAGGFRCAR